MADDEFSEFDELLSTLELLADAIDPDSEPDADVEQALGGWLQSEFADEPLTLVDLRAMRFDDGHISQVFRAIEAEPLPELAPGAVVDQKYEILGQAPRAAGGWEARHVVLRQKFVIQLLASSIVDDPIIWPKFQRDIRAAGMLGHDNIEFVTDMGRCEQYGGYLVKQATDGALLSEWLESAGKQTPATAVAFAHAIGTAVAALHEIGIIHGRLSMSSIRRVETSNGVAWKLLDVCIPGGSDVLLAPEQQRGEATGPEADQYAIAFLTWQLLVGPTGTLDDTPDAPAALIAALRTALDDTPWMRFQDVEALIGEFTRAAPIAPRPSIHPFDSREASRLVEIEIEAKREAEPDAPPAEPAEFERPRSMLIRVLPGDQSATVEIEFNTGARLRREYRRNMLVGGLFVPTAADLVIGSRVLVTLTYSARNVVVDVDSVVVTYDPGSTDRPRGYGLALSVPSRQRIEAFVRDLGLGLGLNPTDGLQVKRRLDASADLTPGAAFLLSRLGTGMTVGEARAMFAGLAYDFDECVGPLLEKGFVVASAAPAPVVSRNRVAPAKPTPAPQPEQPQVRPRVQPKPPPSAAQRPISLGGDDWSNVVRVIETVEFFEERGNFMAAGRVLASATENAPNVAVFHHRLALMRARFDMDLLGARESLRRALELEPDNAEFVVSRRYIGTLIDIAAVRVAWEGELEGEVSWLRTEPALGRVWFLSKGSQTALHEVNYLTNKCVRTSRGAGFCCLAENDPKFDTVERRKPMPIRSARERRVRQVELARRYEGFAPHFERESGSVIRTPNSTLSATIDGGLRVFNGSTQLSQLSSNRVYGPTFAPTEQYVAWSEQQPGKRWGLYVGSITGSGVCRADFGGRPQFFWSDDSSSLIVLDSKENELHSVDRRQGSRLLLQVPPSMEMLLIRSIDDDSVIVCGRRIIGESRWTGTWLNTSSGEVLGEFILPSGPVAGLLRSDGMLTLALQGGGLLVADLNRKVMKPVMSCSPTPASVAGCQWIPGSPLVVTEVSGQSARVFTIDVDLLCG